MDFYKKHYKELYLNSKITTREKKRINHTINFIPDDCNSLLEVGCGDGRIINNLKNNHEKLYGIDINKEALKKVLVPTKQADASIIPFKDNSFDIVLCCEVLEHIPYDKYLQSLNELERVARKYILISVPNNENLKRGSVNCPICGCIFHCYRHLRKYNIEDLNHLFSKSKLIKQKIILQNPNYPFFIIKILKSFKILGSNFPNGALCPQCGYNMPKTQNNALKKSQNKFELLKNATVPLKFKKSGGWIIALYKIN